MTGLLDRYQHIVWDWNGTLINDIELIVEVTNEMLAARSMAPVDISTYRQHFGFPVADFYSKMGFDFAHEPYDALALEFNAEYDRRSVNCSLHDGARELLMHIRQGGRVQTILSAANKDTLRGMVSYFGIDGFFADIAALDDRKAASKLAVGREMLAGFSTPLEATLLIGDTLHDYEVAEELGIDCIIVPNGSNSPDRFSGTGALLVESLYHLR